MATYRYIITDSFMNGRSRISDNTLIKQESSPYYRENENDYDEFVLPYEISAESGLTLNLPLDGIACKTHNTIYRTVNTENDDLGTERNLYTWVDDVPLVLMLWAEGTGVEDGLYYVDLTSYNNTITDDVDWLIGNTIYSGSYSHEILKITKQDDDLYRFYFSDSNDGVSIWVIGDVEPQYFIYDQLTDVHLRYNSGTFAESDIGRRIMFANGYTGIVMPFCADNARICLLYTSPSPRDS